MKDPVLTDEARYDRQCQEQEKRREAAIQDELQRVWDEIGNGEHDEHIWDSAFIDGTNLAKVARQLSNHALAASEPPVDAGAVSNFFLQLENYAYDVAERRVDRTA